MSIIALVILLRLISSQLQYKISVTKIIINQLSAYSQFCYHLNKVSTSWLPSALFSNLLLWLLHFRYFFSSTSMRVRSYFLYFFLKKYFKKEKIFLFLFIRSIEGFHCKKEDLKYCNLDFCDLNLHDFHLFWF